jgi:hypothetical protein
LKSLLKRWYSRLARQAINQVELDRGETLQVNEVVAQKLLMQRYRELAQGDSAVLPSFKDVGFRKYSQYEEDGILLYIFSLIPILNRRCVEVCAGNGRECNTANLIINHGWWGHLFDGDPRNVASGRRFFANCRNTALLPPAFTHAWITAENVNQLIKDSGASGEIDLLSLDIDGMDYWIWKAINVIQPRVVVCEIHNPIPPTEPLTVPYKADFVCEDENYRGASLLAMTKLGRERGYRLVGTHRYGFNAFFVRDDLGKSALPEVAPEACARDPYTLIAQKERWPLVKSREWVRV